MKLLAQINAMWKVRAAARQQEQEKERLEALVLDRTRRLEQQLTQVRRMADEWQATFDSVRDAVWLLDRDLRILHSNAGASRMFDREPEAMVGRYCWEIFCGTQEPMPDCPAIRARESLQQESTVLQQGERWLEATVDPILDAEGRLVGAVHIVSDITERRRAEAALALQAKRSTVLLRLAEAAERMTEAEFMQHGQACAEDLTGSRIGFVHFVRDDEQTIELVSWSARTLENDCRAAFPEHYPLAEAGIWADAARRREPVVFNDYPAWPGRRGLPEGHVGLTRLICAPVIENGKVVMLAGVGNKERDYTDLDLETLQLISNEIWRTVLRRRAETALTRSEESYRTLAEQVPAIIYRAAIDETSSTTYINQAVRSLGYTPQECLVDPGFWAAHVHPEDLPRVVAGLMALHGGGDFAEEYRFQDKAGRWHDIQDEAILVHDPHGAGTFVQGVMLDITERKLAEEQTRQALDLAVRRTEELQGLLEATRAVQEHADSASATKKVLDSARRLLGAERGFLVLTEGEGGGFTVVPTDGDEHLCTPGTDLHIRFFDLWDKAGYSDGPTIINDLEDESLPDDLSTAEAGLDNVLFSPMTLEGRLVGLLALTNKQGGFTGDDLELAKAFGDVASLSYKNARDGALRERAEESLRLSERRYRDLFQNPFTGVAVYEAVDGGADFVIREFSQAAERLVNVPRDRILGRRVSEAFPGVAGMGLLEVFRHVYETGEARHHPPALYVSPGNGSRWFENHVHRLPSGEVVALFEDVTTQQEAETELRESKERYALLFNTSNDAIFVHTLEGRTPGCFVEVNEVACERLGYRREELLRMTPKDIDHPAMDAVRQQAMDTLLAKGHVVFEMVQISKEGEELPVEMSNRLFRYQEETLVMTLARDVAERRLAEEAREALQAQLLQAQKMESVGRLAGGVAHDFNNMLSIILGYGETIFDELHPGDPLREYVRQILAAAHRSADLTRQLLAFSRKQTLQPRVLDLNDIVRDLEKMLRRLIGEHIELELSLSEQTGRVLVDPGQLEQVIMNLVVNARDAMPSGGRLVLKTSSAVLDEAYPETHPEAAAGRYAALTVTDTGCGMTEEVLRRVFDPFYTTKEKGAGTGLGLSTVYGIVRQSEGSISVSSTPGRGTTFEIYLPQTEEEQTLPQIEPASGTRGGERILVVEDEDSLRGLMETVLPRLGYQVTTAANGGEALLLIEERGLQPELIVTDVVMPTMSGRELISRLRRGNPDLKVLYMSGYPDGRVDQQGAIDPRIPYVQKPFSIDALAAKIRAVLDGQAG